jgi:hypothetical protein
LWNVSSQSLRLSVSPSLRLRSIPRIAERL